MLLVSVHPSCLTAGIQTADAEVRLQSAQSIQPSETAAAAASDDPIVSTASVSHQDPQPEMAQSAAKPAAYQPTRFAAEAAQEAAPESGQFGNGQGLNEAEPSATGAQGPLDTPQFGRGAEQVDAQQRVVTQQSSDLDSRQAQGFEGRAGRLPDQPQGFAEQAPDGRGSFASDPAPGLSGVKQVVTALHLLLCITCCQTGVLVLVLLPCIICCCSQQDHSQDLTAVLYWPVECSHGV